MSRARPLPHGSRLFERQEVGFDAEDQPRLPEGLATLLRQQMVPAPHHSVTALRGLGNEIRQGIDAGEYVDRERAAWDG